MRKRPGIVLALAGLVTLIGCLAAQRSPAADYASPSIRAWQRAQEAHLTIEWPETTRVQQKKADDRLLLRFAEPLGTDIGPALRNLSSFVDLDRTTLIDKDLVLALEPGVEAKVRVLEKRIVAVELTRDPAAAPMARIGASAIDNGLRLTVDWPGRARIDESWSENQLRLEVSPAWAIDPDRLRGLERDLKPWISGLRSTRRADANTLMLTPEPNIATSVRSEGISRTVIDLIRDLSTPLAPATGPANAIFVPEKRPAVIADRADISEQRPPLPKKRPRLATVPSRVVEADASAAETGDAESLPTALIFDWKTEVAAAVFLRAGHLWAVFDEADDELLSGIPRSPAGLGQGAVIPADGGTAVRFPVHLPVTFEVSRTPAGAWRIEPVSASTAPQAPLVERVDGARALRLTAASGKRVVSVVDPAVGDRIAALPLRDPGQGQPTRRRFVDLDLLPTVQGLAWRPLNDGLIARVDERGLILDHQRGLSLSTITADATASPEPVILDALARTRSAEEEASRPAVARPASRTAEPDEGEAVDQTEPASYLDLAGSGVERQLVNEIRRIRRQAIGRAAPEDQDRAKLDLARLLIAERLATEARTVLNTIPDESGIDVLRQRRALRGVSAFLNGRLAEASDQLLDPALNDDREIGIWRGALDSAHERWQTAADHWRATSDLLDDYPPRLKVDLGLMALEAAIETGDDDMMRRGTLRLESLGLDPYDQARVDAMEALKAERAGDLERARALLTGLADSRNPMIRTLADFRLAALDLGRGDGGAEDFEAFDRRMPLWRGHPEERAMLDELARRYREAEALRQALTVWRRLVDLYPEAADSSDLEMARRETFLRALSGEVDPPINRLDVYAIYLDFIDLLPDEPEAWEVHRHLARTLGELDLLDEAIDVMQSLMASSTDQRERVDIGAEIATRMLQLQRAGPALAVLDGSQPSGASVPPSLGQRRRLIRAEALARLDRTDEALRELRDLPSQTTRRLQAEILWRERRWPRLAATIDSYFKERGEALPLTVEDQELVLWLALALQQESTAGRSIALRERFGEAMQGGPYAEAFDVATQGIVRARDIQALLAATDDQLAELRRFRRSETALR